MRGVRFVVLCVLLASSQARPGSGYNYASQQQPQLQLNQNQPSSFQQGLPLSQGQPQFAGQYNLPAVTISEQSSSYQPNLPQIPVPALVQSQSQQPSLPQIAEQPSQQIVAPQFPQLPQLVNIVPQTNLDIPQLPIQPQQIPISVTQNPLPPAPQVIQSLQLTQAPLVTKYVYVHVAPEEPPLPPPVIPQPPPPRKAYKILFIKAPSQSGGQRQVIHVPAPQQQVEEKTLVYVLVDKPQQPEIVIPTPAPTQVSKPEVFFIKYKSRDSGASQPIIADQNQGQPINSGESTSSLFSGGLAAPAAKYGPPGYQERNAQ